MDRNCVEGKFKQVKGLVKEVFGKVMGDCEIEVEGLVEQQVGKFQEKVGEVVDVMCKYMGIDWY